MGSDHTERQGIRRQRCARAGTGCSLRRHRDGLRSPGTAYPGLLRSEFEENCLRYYETERPVKTASSEQVRQPIYTSALGLWKKYGDNLAEWQQDLRDIIDDLPASVKQAAG